MFIPAILLPLFSYLLPLFPAFISLNSLLMPLFFWSIFRVSTTSEWGPNSMKWLPGTARRGGTISTWPSLAPTAKLCLTCSLSYLAPSQLDLEDLEEPQQKKARVEAAKFKEEMLGQEGVMDTSKETVLYPASLPIPTEFGLEKDFIPLSGIWKNPAKPAVRCLPKLTTTYCL